MTIQEDRAKNPKTIDRPDPTEASQEASAAWPWPFPFPIPALHVSGKYEMLRPFPFVEAGAEGLELDPSAVDAGAIDPVPWPFPWWFKGTLNLDVDGTHPQRAASGSFERVGTRVHWIAHLTKVTGQARWIGSIWYKDGAAARFPFTTVDIRVSGLLNPDRRARVEFKGAGLVPAVFRFAWRSRAFHDVEFEFDATKDANPVLAIDRHAHPNRPATLSAGTLTVQEVFRQSGFGVKTSPNVSTVPGGDGVWSDAEMHDAMQVYWSRFANKPQWAMWVFHAARHEMGHGLGGIMFDDIGPNHRQGTAIFTESFIQDVPPGDPAPDAWRKRQGFWTTVHEMGHAFNLAHSWQKSYPVDWIPLTDDPEARSFMNYPDRVEDEQKAFFKSFEFRFTDPELLYLRHAPERFVQMGNADWFDHHGFEQGDGSDSAFRLDLQLNRAGRSLQFLEPAMVDMTLTNVSEEPKIVGEHLLSDLAELTIVVKREGHPERQYRPYATYLRKRGLRVLQPGESLSDTLFLGADRSAARDGWLLAEPGRYAVQAKLELGAIEIVSAPLEIRVDCATSRDEERLAQDYLCDDVGRVLFFDGSSVLDSANNALRELLVKLPETNASIHGAIALARGASNDGRTLTFEAKGAEPAKFTRRKAQADEARRYYKMALETRPDLAAQSLGRADFRFYVERYEGLLPEPERKATKTLIARADQRSESSPPRRPRR